ncbi:helix-turn-helix domain-containing protein [Bacillus pseudomycoides]|uniref:helix-turn-helix domain-containing protein n=1 Tax=Bacillus pseudomycoides TaxID=64104 RepID=UPI0015CF6D26|nr:helix-turn-helix domain-containing protein [Bacillus pseudomycoides]
MDQQQNVFGVFSGQVSEMLDINTNTLRTWSLELEKFDYNFERNKRQQRIYYPHDVEVLQEMKKLMGTGTYTIQESIQKVLESRDLQGSNGQTGSVLEDQKAVMTRDEPNNALNQMGLAFLEQASTTMNEMMEQQNQIAMQNQQIISMFLDEKKAREQVEIEKELERRENEKLRGQLEDMQSKIDKIFEYVEDNKDTGKSFLQKLFNRNPKKTL